MSLTDLLPALTSSSDYTLKVRGSTQPLQRNHTLDQYDHTDSTPFIGTEFKKDSGLQLSELIEDKNADELIKDLAILISQRGVVYFREQDLTLDQQKVLGRKLGELSGKPSSSGLHIHPTTEDRSPKGDNISVISSERRAVFNRGSKSSFASNYWHTDISFEPVPADYSILKVHTNPSTGGDTLWASAYEAYSRLSPSLAKYLEGLSAFHEAAFFKDGVARLGNKLRTGERGSPLNKGDDLAAVHPVIRVNPVTGWKGLYVNREFTKRILGISQDESDLLLEFLFKLVSENHDLQVRFKWTTNNEPGRGDVAIWDNRSTFHSATFDYGSELRVGDRVVSVGEEPYFDPAGKERREALGLPSFWE